MPVIDPVDLAARLISTPSVTPAQGAVFDVLDEALSALLDYSDVRAFRRAFTRWTGATPARHRTALVESGPDHGAEEV